MNLNLINNIDKYLREEQLVEISNFKSQSPVEQYKLNTIVRLVYAFNAYFISRKKNYVLDAAVSLRDYLSVFKKPIFRSDVSLPVEQLEKVGIAIDPESGQLGVSMNFPTKVNVNFINEVLNPVSSDQVTNPSLFTDSRIYQLTGYKQFKTIQQKLCTFGALKSDPGSTLLISLPTGSGKSMITQLLGTYNENPGLTVVVVPTVALAIDQCRAARTVLGYKPSDSEIQCHIGDNGKESVVSITRAIQENRLRILFLSPESLIRNKSFENVLKLAAKKKYLNHLVIDEAHLILEWGLQFRTDFMNLSVLNRKLRKENPDLKTVFLSATYDKRTTNTICALFQRDDKPWIELRCDSLRREPRFMFLDHRGTCTKLNDLTELVLKLPHPLIVYVRKPEQAEELKKHFNQQGLDNVQTFTGLTKNSDRKSLIQDWNNNKFSIMIATNAFGVGVDKGDIRTVIHNYIPSSASSFYQELGRGGRDGLPCLSVMNVATKGRSDIADYPMMATVLTSEKILGRWKAMFLEHSTLNNGLYQIDTSTIPDYSGSLDEDDIDDDLVSAGYQSFHINWNIYVLFLFYRYNLIDIQDIKFEQGHYFYLITVNDDRIRYYDENLMDLIESIRNKESYENERENQILRKSIKNDGMECWSEMFYQSFPLAPHFCAGCPEHDYKVEEHSDYLFGKPVPYQNINNHSFLSQPNEMLMYTGSMKMADILLKLSKLSPDVILMDPDTIEAYQEIFLNTCFQNPVLLLTPKEYLKLVSHRDYFFTSGVIAVIYSDDPKTSSAQYSKVMGKVSQLIDSHMDHQFIHLVRTDFFVETAQKYISEITNGSVEYLEYYSRSY